MSKKAFLKIHPLTLKSIESGHPWVTLDQFSKKFPEDKQFIELYHPETTNFLGTYLNDKKHPKVKARFWSNSKEVNFPKELKNRLKKAFEKRTILNLKRNNYYLCFGESDLLPGLFIQKLSNHLLIQFQSYFWLQQQEQIIEILLESFDHHRIWIQLRIPEEQKLPPIARCEEINEEEFTIEEFGIKYKIKMNQNHDIGIYSDMSGIREKLIPYFENKKEVLNLFCYTGAFSLLALDKGSKVTSVDLSKKYLSWLEENIELNNINKNQHQTIVKSCQKKIDEYHESKTKFDLIICDPPTVSTDGKKRMKATDFYKTYINKIFMLMNDNAIAVIILNTHQIPLKKFKELIRNNCKQQPKLINEFKLSDDCIPLANFPEGDYLKCLLFKK